MRVHPHTYGSMCADMPGTIFYYTYTNTHSIQQPHTTFYYTTTVTA